MTVLLEKTWDLGKDHEAIKKQIKEWELAVDKVKDCLEDERLNLEEGGHYDCIEDLERISQEMMAVNI